MKESATSFSYSLWPFTNVRQMMCGYARAVQGGRTQIGLRELLPYRALFGVKCIVYQAFSGDKCWLVLRGDLCRSVVGGRLRSFGQAAVSFAACCWLGFGPHEHDETDLAGQHPTQGSVGSRMIAGLEEFADALERNEVVSRQLTCRKLHLQLRPETDGPDLVRLTRKLLNASQAIFAQFLGVSAKTVRSWEQGVTIPKAIACRFMDDIRRNPGHFQERLRASITDKEPGNG